MRHALRLARGATRRAEVPVGCVAELDGRVLAAASNRVEATRDATRHAEMEVLSACARRLGDWRLAGVTLYVTLEPCPMCAGAMLLSRVPRIVYGADDPRKGAFRSAYDVLANPSGNHHPRVDRGLLSNEAADLLLDFFRQLRTNPGARFSQSPPLAPRRLRR
jgi:tRNA(adenine34) deaminase